MILVWATKLLKNALQPPGSTGGCALASGNNYE